MDVKTAKNTEDAHAKQNTMDDKAPIKELLKKISEKQDYLSFHLDRMRQHGCIDSLIPLVIGLQNSWLKLKLSMQEQIISDLIKRIERIEGKSVLQELIEEPSSNVVMSVHVSEPTPMEFDELANP